MLTPPPNKLNEDFLDTCKLQNIKKAKNLLIWGADIHYKEDYALYEAVNNSHIDTVKFLIENGAKVDSRASKYFHGSQDDIENRSDNDCKPLSIAVYNIDNEIAKDLIKNGADIYADNCQALMFALFNSNTEMVNYLLERMTDLEKIKREIELHRQDPEKFFYEHVLYIDSQIDPIINKRKLDIGLSKKSKSKDVKNKI